MKNYLDSLIPEELKNKFIQSYDENTPFIVHNLNTKIKELTDISFLKSIDDLLELWPEKVDVYPAHISDETGAISSSTQEAEKMFKIGRGLLFNDANTISPVLQKWLDGLRLGLGLSSMTYSRNLIYATKKDTGTDTHFDQNINFVLQIHGTKKWQISTNTCVENPLTRHTIGLPVDPHLESYASTQFPKEMPLNKKEFTLSPGSMLFVPRGCWHSTQAASDALSLNFTFSPPTWIDMFTTALKERLSYSPEWRETAQYVSSTERRLEAIEKFDSLLSSLSYEIPSWQAKDILNALEQE